MFVSSTRLYVCINNYLGDEIKYLINNMKGIYCKGF